MPSKKSLGKKTEVQEPVTTKHLHEVPISAPAKAQSLSKENRQGLP
jgi:hypothetical protein